MLELSVHIHEVEIQLMSTGGYEILGVALVEIAGITNRPLVTWMFTGVDDCPFRSTMAAVTPVTHEQPLIHLVHVIVMAMVWLNRFH